MLSLLRASLMMLTVSDLHQDSSHFIDYTAKLRPQIGNYPIFYLSNLNFVGVIQHAI
jgi:hypothetical protein